MGKKQERIKKTNGKKSPSGRKSTSKLHRSGRVVILI